VTNEKLQVVQFDDFTIDVKMSGNEIPRDVYVEVGNNTFRLEKENLDKLPLYI
jgi:hypothetical protein